MRVDASSYVGQLEVIACSSKASHQCWAFASGFIGVSISSNVAAAALHRQIPPNDRRPYKMTAAHSVVIVAHRFQMSLSFPMYYPICCSKYSLKSATLQLLRYRAISKPYCPNCRQALRLYYQPSSSTIFIRAILLLLRNLLQF